MHVRFYINAATPFHHTCIYIDAKHRNIYTIITGPNLLLEKNHFLSFCSINVSSIYDTQIVRNSTNGCDFSCTIFVCLEYDNILEIGWRHDIS